MLQTGLISRFKKGIATILTASVLLTGVLAITPLTSAASTASASSTDAVFHKSKNGKEFWVTKNGVTVFDAKQSSDNDAEVSYTSKGKNLKLKIHIDKLTTGEYQSTVTDENTGKSNKFVSKTNPFIEKLNPSMVKSTVNAPNAVIYAIMAGGFNAAFWSTFGGGVAAWCTANFSRLESAFFDYGYWAVFYMILDSEVIGPIAVGALVA